MEWYARLANFVHHRLQQQPRGYAVLGNRGSLMRFVICVWFSGGIIAVSASQVVKAVLFVIGFRITILDCLYH